jgi:hypothetical protein
MIILCGSCEISNKNSNYETEWFDGNIIRNN